MRSSASTYAAEGTGIRIIEVVRGRPRWAQVTLGLGIAVLALSLAPGWLVHNRTVGGEGFRTLTLLLNAWQLWSVPVLSMAAVMAALAGVAAVLPAPDRRWLPTMAAGPLGLLAAGLVPLSHSAHVTSVSVTPGWILFVTLAAVAGMLVLLLRGLRPPRGFVVLAAAVLLVAGIGGGLLRLVQVQLAEAVSTHWSPGSYSRQADGQSLQLTLGADHYATGAYSGDLETAGISIILTGDPACPDARGFYHVRSAGEGAILLERVIDVCADGDRAAALDGVWTAAVGQGSE